MIPIFRQREHRNAQTSSLYFGTDTLFPWGRGGRWAIIGWVWLYLTALHEASAVVKLPATWNRPKTTDCSRTATARSLPGPPPGGVGKAPRPNKISRKPFGRASVETGTSLAAACCDGEFTLLRPIPALSSLASQPCFTSEASASKEEGSRNSGIRHDRVVRCRFPRVWLNILQSPSSFIIAIR